MRLIRKRFAGLAAGALGLLSACGGTPGGITGDPAGPCVHAFEGGLVRIESAVNAATNTPVATIRVSNLSVNGAPPVGNTGNVNIRFDGPNLICDVACRFGVTEGVYRFTVTAPGFQPLDVEQEARYTEFRGGCPSSSSGSNVELSLRLVPAS